MLTAERNILPVIVGEISLSIHFVKYDKVLNVMLVDIDISNEVQFLECKLRIIIIQNINLDFWHYTSGCC